MVMSKTRETMLDKTCRICASFTTKKSDLVSIFSILSPSENSVNSVRINEELASISISITEHELPQKICSQCVTELRNIRKFRELYFKTKDELSKAFDLPLKAAISTQSTVHTTAQTKNENIIELNEYDSEESNVNEINKDEFSEIYSDDNNDDMISIQGISDNLPYSCWYCEKNFDIFSELRNHERQEHENKSFTCVECNIYFLTDYDRQIHLKRMHRSKMGIGVYQCEYCGKIFNDPTNLKRHIRSHTTSNIVGTGSKRNSKSLYSKNYYCPFPQCQKIYIIPQALEKHMKLHDKSRQYHCIECDLHYTTSKSLKYHIKQEHTKRNNFHCQFCSKVFQNEKIRDRHYKRHFDRKRFKCNECNRDFTNVQYFRVHQRLHSGEKPSICVICGESFVDNRYLQVHQKNHTTEEHENLRRRIVFSEIDLEEEKHKRLHKQFKDKEPLSNINCF